MKFVFFFFLLLFSGKKSSIGLFDDDIISCKLDFNKLEIKLCKEVEENKRFLTRNKVANSQVSETGWLKWWRKKYKTKI